MANNTTSNNTLLWLLSAAVCFLLGKTCNCNKEKMESPGYYRAVITQPDTSGAVKESTITVKPAYRRSGTHQYIRGPRGGCYYINSNGNKVYVDRSICN